MYLAHFGLDQAPFSITPNPDFFYAGGKRGEILEALTYAVRQGEGIVKVTGEVGSGKTMLCRMLESRLPENVEVLYLVNPTLGRDAVLYAIASEIGLATDGKRADEVIRLLQEDLIRKHAAGKRVLLVVEEAQAMPLDTLEEIRLFSNLETAHSKLLQMILFGQPELDESLKLPRMRQLRERITHSFVVPPLEPSAIRDYLMFRLRAAGYRGEDIFSAAALRRIASVSRGIMRRVSILGDKTMLAAFADGARKIERKHVDAAIKDSEFSPRSGRIAVMNGKAWLGLGIGAAAVAILAALPGQWTGSGNGNAPHAALAAQAAATENPLLTASSAEPLMLRLSAARDWLRHAEPTRYTVQLAVMPAANRAQVNRFLQRLETEVSGKQGHPIFVYPTESDDGERFGITFGSYESRQEAVIALNKLSDEWGYRPQLRTAKGLRQEMARTGSTWPLPQ